MGEIELRGAGALRRVPGAPPPTTSAACADGQAQYSLLLTPTGGIVDDIIVHRRAADRVFSASTPRTATRDLAYLREHVRGAEVVDRSDDYALLALQGPRADAPSWRGSPPSP